MEPRQFAQTYEETTVDRWVPSTCGLCSIGCRLDIGVSDNEIVGVRGRTDHPVNRGRLGPKGLNQYYANAHPSRARHPLIRSAAGTLQRASWDAALQVVVSRIGETIATDGPDAVGIYNSGQLLLEEYYTLGKLARAGLGLATIDANTRLCTATTGYSLIESFGADGPPGAYEDLDETDCIVLVGHNAAEQSTVLWMRVLAAKAGPRKPKIIVIDPRRTLTATGADLHLRLAPGTNVALLNGICHLLIANGWIDTRFIARHTKGFDGFRETMAKYTPELVHRITGVAEADLVTAARWIGTSERTVTTCLQGVYQSNQATAAACTVNSLHLLMGKIGRPGCAPFQFAGQPSSMNTRETGADGAYPAYRNWENPQHMHDLARLWRVRPEVLGKKPVAAPELFEMCEKGQMKVLWNIGTNPAVSMTDRTRQLRTLNGVFLIVQDAFETPTAQLADVFLPTALWGEKTGCMTNAERRCTLLERAVPPPGEARSDFDIFLDVARRMDVRDVDGDPLIAYGSPEEAFNEWCEVSRGCIPDYSRMSYERLRTTGGLQWPCNDNHPDGTIRLYTDWHFPTQSSQTETFEKDLDTGHELTFRAYRDKHDPDGRAVLMSSEYKPAPEAPDTEYPFTAITGRLAYHWHTRTKTNKAPMLHDAAPEVFVSMNVEDAAALVVEDGDIVRVRSRRGAITAPVKVGDIVPPRVIFVPFHFGDLGEATAANNLTSKLEDPVSKQPLQKLAAVRVERVRA